MTKPVAPRTAFESDPERDRALAELLGAHAGRVPHDSVDWSRLAQRISASVALHAVSPWWTYAERWERRVIPIALAAGIAAAAALWNTQGDTISPSHELLAAVVDGTPSEEVVRQFARSVTSTAADLTVGVPE